jgi:formate hydrogenlyase subunit 3/multisubunit Na+/H+ antiporter MnhD subunit
MNQLSPIFVVVPLAGAFLVMILGKFFRDINKFLTSLILLFLLTISIISLINTGTNVSVYKVGGWEPVNMIPIGIYMVMDSFTTIILCIINLIGFLSVIYSVSYISK